MINIIMFFSLFWGFSGEKVVEKGTCIEEKGVLVSEKRFKQYDRRFSYCEKLDRHYLEVKMELETLKTENNCPSCFIKSFQGFGYGLVMGLLVGFIVKD